MTQFIVNHLWQSSCCALLAALLAFALRNNSPKVRYWVWLSASLKFLLPFALLVSVGGLMPQPTQTPAIGEAPLISSTLVDIAAPYSQAPGVPTDESRGWIPLSIGAVWVVGFLLIALARYRGWLRVRATLRAGKRIALPISIPAVIVPGAEEPGIVGFLRPVLVLPAQLLDQLNPEQLSAILAHEMCHVCRRDNVFAAVHMVVEAVFWFHPLVWWVGSRMVEERELACDEEVLRMGCEPTDYVEGILRVCRFCKESPLPCVSGVRGSDVKKRLHSILAGHIGRELTVGKKLTLAVAGFAILAAPLIVGILAPQAVRAQNASANSPAFEVTSVKPFTGRGPGFQGIQPGCKGGHFEAITPVFLTISWAYGLRTAQQLVELQGKMPLWAQSVSGAYELEATTRPDVTEEECRKMAQKLFEDRFHFKYHWDTITGTVYEMVVVRGGFKMPPADPNDRASNLSVTINGRLSQPPPAEFPVWEGATMDDMASRLSTNPGRIPVIDKTGIKGKYKLKLRYSAGPGLNADFADPDMVTAVEQQLGLKLQEARGPVAHFVVDSIEKPDAN